MPRAVIHVDMDAFYASVEQRDDPSLRGRPVIVGGHPKRGVVLAASYEVRPFGVRSAIPMARAMRLCPHAVVVPPRFEVYADVSEQIHAIFESVTPLVEPLSLDEAFLDVTGSGSLFGPPGRIASHVRGRIARELSLPASAGIATVKFVAKMASDLAKPNGQREVPGEETTAFLRPLPVSRLWGVGARMEESMRALGLLTIGDVAAHTPEWLARNLGSAGAHFWELAHGIDERAVVPDREAKSIGAEDTFEHDVSDPEDLRPHLLSQALRVGRRLRRAQRRGRAVVLKLKRSDFTLLTRRTTLPVATDDGQEIYRAALALLDRAGLDTPVRLTGVSVQDLGGDAPQMELFGGESQRRKKLNAAVDSIAAKFGRNAVMPAELLGHEPVHDDEEARRKLGASRLDALAAKGKGRATEE